MSATRDERACRIAAPRTWVSQLPGVAWWSEADGTGFVPSAGWSAYAACDDDWLSALHPDELPEARARWQGALSSGGALEQELRLRHKDGAYRWFRASVMPLRDAAGKLDGWLGVHVDIHAQRERIEHLSTQFRNAQRVAGVGSFELDVANGEMVWSDEMFRIMGVDPREGTPRYVAGAPSPMIIPESFERLEQALARAVREAVGYEVALEGRLPSGAVTHWIARGEPLVDGAGKVLRIVGTVQDVTEREQVERQLRTLSERLQLAASAARLGVWDWDLTHDVLDWDPAMRELYSLPEGVEAMNQRTWWSLVHPDDRPELEAALQAALRGTQSFNATFRVLVPNGRPKHVRAMANTYRNVDGRGLRMVGVQVDISDQRGAELALRESEALQRAMFAHAGVSIIAVDNHGMIKLFNRGAEELLAYRASDVIGQRAQAFAHDPAEIEQRRLELERELEMPLPRINDVFVAKARTGAADVHEWTYVRSDGSRVPVLLTVTAIRDHAGTIGGYLSVAVDLSQRKDDERALIELNALLAERSTQAESANRAKSEFIANMSHDLRTPLAAVTGMSYLLGRTSLDEEQRALLTTIERSSKGLALMVNDILDLSKIEANQLALDEQPFTIASVLDELRGLMAGFALGKPLELIIEAEPSRASTLLGDRVRVLQVLTNFVSNAIKFSERGAVHLRVREVGAHLSRRWLRFEVEDSGPGISAGEVTGLFERFQRLDNATSRRVSGSGLGLAIAKQLSALMGGRVGVTSELGVGSTFWCELPFEAVGPPQARAEPGLAGSLLIIDGNEAQRHAIASSARGLGWSAVTAATVDEASVLLAQRLREERPIDCVVLDRKLPFSEVRAALDERALRRRPSVVLLSAQDGERDSLLAPLAQVVLGKPVTPSTLRNAIARAMTTRWSTRPPSRRSTGPVSSKRLLTVRALVVDDNDVNREIARRILSLEGAEVELACDGPSALERVSTQEFDVVLMDVQLPGMDGSEVVQRMRRLEAGASVPIVALTASALASDRARALAAGMNEFIAKPFEPEMLIHSVRTLVEQARGSALPEETRIAPASEEPCWPQLEGIDSGESERRLCGDRELFRALLARVLDELESFVAAPPEPDAQRLGRTLHRLRGMTGNIGARGISQLLGTIERSLGARDPASVQAGLELLPREVRRVREGSREFLRASRPPPEVTIAQGELPARVDTLIELLRAQDLDAVPLFDELSTSLAEAFGGERCHALRDAVDRLDFARAADLLGA